MIFFLTFYMCTETRSNLYKSYVIVDKICLLSWRSSSYYQFCHKFLASPLMGCLGPRFLKSILPTKALNEVVRGFSFLTPSKDFFRNLLMLFCFLRSNKVLADLWPFNFLFCYCPAGKKKISLNGNSEFSGSYSSMNRNS